jgi:hypothetical protein
MSITVKGGNRGENSLIYRKRVPKSDIRIAAYGSVDELTSALRIFCGADGLCRPNGDGTKPPPSGGRASASRMNLILKPTKTSR